MNIAILTIGTQGDVLPYIALGAGLRSAGHNVTLATSARFERLAAERELQFAPLSADLLELMETRAGRDAIAGKGRLQLMRQIGPMMRTMLDECWAAAQGAQALIYHPKTLGGAHIAEALGIPAAVAFPVPALAPTAAFANPLFAPGRSFGPALNRLSYQLFLKLLALPYRGLINRWRHERLGLPPRTDDMTLHGRPIPLLYGFSPLVVPPPPDWGESTVVTGDWFLDQSRGWQPPAALTAFLNDGPPPVYVGFGSMAGSHAARVTQIVVEALTRTGQRGLLATGVGGLTGDALPPHVFAVQAAPHDWLFPRVSAVVHHGGAGTTAAGLRAGKPSVICPFFGDQPFWGQRVAALGVGPQPIPQRRLTVERLTEAIEQAVGDATMRQRAADLGARIAAERGVERAVVAFEELIVAAKWRVAGALAA